MRITLWQKEYKEKKFYWGLKPEKGLKEALKYAPKGIALDIGAGEGRNSIFLAKNGFKVEAIDRAKEKLEKCKELTRKYKLPINTKVIDIRKFKFEKNKYSLIAVIASLDFLKFSEIKKIIPKIRKSLKKKGVLYLVVFSIKDPAFNRCKKNLKMIEKNTFYLPELKTYRHFFKIQEISSLLKDFELLKIEEKKKKDISHGKTHFHQIITATTKKGG